MSQIQTDPSHSFRRSARMSGIQLSEIVQISERARALRAEGRNVVALSTGEPDFPTPDNVIAAAHRAALDGKTTYPPTMGTVDLRAAIADQAGVSAAQVIVSTGAKQVLSNAMLATLDPGDEVIMPAPYWTSYSDIVAMAGGTPVVLTCDMAQGFKLTAAQLAAAITDQTRWVMLNSPSNPSGAIYSVGEQAELADVLRAHPHVMVLVDEIYAHLSYTPFTSFAEVAPDLADRILIVNGVSKAYAMTGWRIGWGIGPVEMIRALGAVQGQVTSGACSISQASALEAISGDQSLLVDRRRAMCARRDRMVTALNGVAGITCPVPDGAFYVFPDIRDAMAAGGFATDAEFCSTLLEQAGVAIVPGRAFGLPGHARLSFAYSDAEIDTGLTRIAEFVASF